MLFLESDIDIRLLSVRRLRWENVDADVSARPFNALSFRLTGDSVVSADGTSGTLKTDDIFFMPQGLRYRQKTGSEEVIAVHFDVNGEVPRMFEIMHADDSEVFRKLFLSLYDVWNGREQGYYFRASSILYDIFARMSRRFSSIVTNASYEKIREAVNYIYKNFTSPTLTVEALCRMSYMSDTFFRRLFSEVFGVTPLRFIHGLRIGYARELLETGYYTVAEVAEKCGFPDVKYFSTTFRRITGKTPSSVRRSLTKKRSEA